MNVLLLVRAQARESPAPDDVLRGTLEHHTSYDGFKEAIAISCRICQRLREVRLDDDIGGDQMARFHIQCHWSIPQTTEIRKSVLLSFRHVAPEDDVGGGLLFDLVPVEPETGIFALMWTSLSTFR